MVELLKRVVKRLFVPAEQPVVTIYKTRTQLIEEGRSAYLPKRCIHGTPRKF